MRDALGKHVLIEFYRCNTERLSSVEHIEEILLRAAREARAKVVTSSFHQFQPYGVSGVVVIEESHFTIHTWPEHGYAAVDLFFCAPTVDMERAVQVLNDSLQSQEHQSMEVRRGTHAVEPRSKSPVPKAG